VWIALWSLDTTGGATPCPPPPVPFTAGRGAEEPPAPPPLLRAGLGPPPSRPAPPRGGVWVLGLDKVLRVGSWGGLAGAGRGRQVRRRVVLLRALQLARQPAQGHHHQDPECDHHVLGPAAAYEGDQAAGA